jgi:hypothetical protein
MDYSGHRESGNADTKAPTSTSGLLTYFLVVEELRELGFELRVGYHTKCVTRLVEDSIRPLVSTIMEQHWPYVTSAKTKELENSPTYCS